jgi:hypothetical protein
MILPSIIIVLFLIVLLIDKNCIHMYSRKLLWPLNIYLIFNITDTWTFISLDVLILLFTFLFRPVCSFEFNSQIENIVQPYSENWKMLFLCLLGHFLEDHNQMATFSFAVCFRHYYMWKFYLSLQVCLTHILHDANHV